MKRGLLGRCPHCGEGRLFRAFLKVADHCAACGQDSTTHRADDLPAYLVIVIVGHIVVPVVLSVETNYAPDLAAPRDLAAADAGCVAGAAAAGQGRGRRPAMGAAHARLRRQSRAEIPPVRWTERRTDSGNE